MSLESAYPTLVAAIKAADLDLTLAATTTTTTTGTTTGGGTGCLFAPTEEAFRTLLDALDVDAAQLLAATEALTAVLSLHLDVRDDCTQTAKGDKVGVAPVFATVTTDASQICDSASQYLGLVVYEIDTVLLPNMENENENAGGAGSAMAPTTPTGSTNPNPNPNPNRNPTTTTTTNNNTNNNNNNDDDDADKEEAEADEEETDLNDEIDYAALDAQEYLFGRFSSPVVCRQGLCGPGYYSGGLGAYGGYGVYAGYGGYARGFYGGWGGGGACGSGTTSRRCVGFPQYRHVGPFAY